MKDIVFTVSRLCYEWDIRLSPKLALAFFTDKEWQSLMAWDFCVSAEGLKYECPDFTKTVVDMLTEV